MEYSTGLCGILCGDLVEYSTDYLCGALWSILRGCLWSNLRVWNFVVITLMIV